MKAREAATEAVDNVPDFQKGVLTVETDETQLALAGALGLGPCRRLPCPAVEAEMAPAVALGLGPCGRSSRNRVQVTRAQVTCA